MGGHRRSRCGRITHQEMEPQNPYLKMGNVVKPAGHCMACVLGTTRHPLTPPKQSLGRLKRIRMR